MSPERNRGKKLSGKKPRRRRRQRAAGYAVLASGLLVIGVAYAAVTGPVSIASYICVGVEWVSAGAYLP